MNTTTVPHLLAASRPRIHLNLTRDASGRARVTVPIEAEPAMARPASFPEVNHGGSARGPADYAERGSVKIPIYKIRWRCAKRRKTYVSWMGLWYAPDPETGAIRPFRKKWSDRKKA